MKKVLGATILAVMISSVPAIAGLDGDLTGGVIRSVVKETLSSKEESIENKTWDREMRSRIDEENQKIDLGVKLERIAKRDARNLKDELNSILDKMDRMKKEGQVSQREKDSLENDIDRLDQKISGARSETSKRY